MRSRLLSLGVAVSGLAFLFGTASAHASAITFATTGTGSDGPLSASADFFTSAGQLQVTLTNTLAANVIRSAGQALSDISFTLSNAPGTLGTASASGQLANVSSTGVVTYTSSSNPTRWLGAGGQGLFSISGNTITMEVVGGGQPSQMIAPSIANGGTYGNVNNGFGGFGPYVTGSATFIIPLSGVTANTNISNVTFSFGTSPDTFLGGTPPPIPTPEPSALVLLGTGMAGATGLLQRRLARA